MLDEMHHLVELQRLDAEIYRRQEVLATLPGRRQQLEEASTDAAAALAAAHEAHQAAELQLRQAEAALQVQEALLRKLEGQQFQVKDNTAYTALLNEMEHAQAAISGCETRILEGMDAVEASKKTLATAAATDAGARERQESEQREIAAREARLDGEVAEFCNERDAVRPRLDGAVLAVYEKVAKRKRPALALVKDEMCGGCRVGIPAQNYIEILKGERIVTCGNCQRILLHSEKVAALPAAVGG